jgi:antitoxin (DNA-binding transcriptional repressor) of toxin-antitoxin stability system
MAIMTMTEARAVLPEVLDRVAAGEEITITRYGKPAAVILRPDIVYTRARVEVATGPGGHHGLSRRRSAACRRIIEAPAMPVDDLLGELDSLRGRRA